MKARIDYTNVPEALRGMYQLEHYIHNSGLEESLVHLVKMRASQINGCAYCLDLHSKDARALGETEQRLYVLDAWEEAPFYSERERAALALTDAVTRITEGHVPDAVFERARAHFNEQELIALVFTLTTINARNRLLSRCVPRWATINRRRAQSPKPLKIGICLSKRRMDHFRIAHNPGTISPMGPRSEMSYCDDL
jgi:AhpD family alkylhydroperoxidase